MSVDFEKVNNRIQILEQDNKELHDRLDYLSSGQHIPKHNNVSFTWSEEVQQEIVDTVSIKALRKSQDEVLKSASFVCECLRFIGGISILSMVLLLGSVVKNENLDMFNRVYEAKNCDPLD